MAHFIQCFHTVKSHLHCVQCTLQCIAEQCMQARICTVLMLSLLWMSLITMEMCISACPCGYTCIHAQYEQHLSCKTGREFSP